MSFYKLLPIFSLCFLVTACGFHPLYVPFQERSEDISYPVKIATILDRDGQILRNHLLDLLTPEGSPPHPLYILEVVLSDTVRNTGINKNETASRKEAILTGVFTLRDARTNAIVYQHTAKVMNSFSIINQNYYADLIAEEYAKKEAIRLLAEKIVLFITTHLNPPQ